MTEPVAVTIDGFLGGRLSLVQPKRGFRAGHDTVLLAAAVPAIESSTVLELGAGVGIASLCLAARVPGVRVLGIEVDPALVELANRNAAQNGLADRVQFQTGDVSRLPGRDPFDHVFFNPPFHPASGQQSPNIARSRAMRDEANTVSEWARTALPLTKPGGTITVILRADRVNDMITACDGMAATIFPLFPHLAEAPKRILVQVTKGEFAAPRIAKGLVLHEKDGRNTDAAEAVLRHGAPLRLV